jgi:TPP-dependent indolepyruvate ferredoxin oxidoreductase alpha subunit
VRGLWSTNEKVALEEGVGCRTAGKRAIVSMKHVGLNVAADPFMNLGVSGVHGGLVIVVADDPGMHSSQNEQDSRCFADFAMVPCLEPADQQQCYNFTREAFELSERFQTPVLLRLVTRLAHSRSAGGAGRAARAEPGQLCRGPGALHADPGERAARLCEAGGEAAGAAGRLRGKCAEPADAAR